MNIENKTQLKGKVFKCLRVVKGWAVEDTDDIRTNILKAIEDVPKVEMTETETAFELNNGQFFMKPKQKREQIGVLDCTRSYATFDGVRIEYKDMDNLWGSCFETTNAKYAIHAFIK